MANENGLESSNPKKKAIGAELVLPCAALLFTLYYFSTIIDVPWVAQVSAFFVGSILILLVAVFFVRSVIRVQRGEATMKFAPLFAPREYIPKRLALLGLTFGYIIFIQWGGFTITTFFFLLFAMLLLSGGKKKGLILSLSLILSIGGYFLFIVAFNTRFPTGPVEIMLKGMF